MAKRKVEWTNLDNVITIKIIETGKTADFDLSTIKGMVIPEGIAFDAMLHGFRQKLADSIAGEKDVKKMIPTVTALFDKIKESGEWVTRKPASAKVDVAGLLAKAGEMDFDEKQMELLKSLIGQTQAAK